MTRPEPTAAVVPGAPPGRIEPPAPLPAGRRAVLYTLRRRGEATAEQVAEQLGMTVSGARQHLSGLVEQGLADARELPSPAPRRGRRVLAYTTTDAADVYFPKAYGELTNELLGYVAERDPALLDELFSERREHRIASARARLARRRSPGARVAELAEILDEDGYLATHERIAPRTYRVVEHNCAIWAVAQRYGQACTSEIDFLRAVLPEASIQRVRHMVAGAPHCAYEIRFPPAG
jgi:DeoR family suf operon transcriptional repressor